MEQGYFDEILCPSITDTGQKCGSPLQCHQKFCCQCGSKVIASWFVKQTVSPQTCTGLDEDGKVCGCQLDSSAKFCSNCGTRSESNMFTVCVVDTYFILLLFITRMSLELQYMSKLTLCSTKKDTTL